VMRGRGVNGAFIVLISVWCVELFFQDSQSSQVRIKLNLIVM
jgi:hypothetical protein